MARFALLAIFVALGCVSAAEQQAGANPVRKVVNMLQSMQKKVTAEGEKEKELFEKFMCYCKHGDEALAKSIGDADNKMPQVSADIEAGENEVKQLKADLKSHQTDRAAAKTSMAEATGIREKEAADFAALKAEADANIQACTKATTAIEKGMAGSFLQTAEAQVLKKLVLAKNDIHDFDREELTAFLSNSEGYAPQSGQITGILKQMLDTMNADLAEATATENAAIKAYNELMAAKEKEVNALTKAIEEKMVRLGKLQVEIVEMKEDLDDTAKALAEDQKFLADLKKNCATKADEHAENMKLRSQELLALADTIKILNDDDALELFKKTLPGASSFMQLQVTAADQRRQALAVLRAARGSRPELNFIALALQGKKVNFGKVIKMIDEMVANLGAEQQDDDDKKEYCNTQFDLADDKKKGLERSVANLEKAIAKAKEGIAALAEEIKALEEGIVALDKSVAEATEQRKEENADYKELMASDGAAKELLGFAKNRLNKFYHPKLYKAPPKKVLTDEDRAVQAAGGTVFADVSAHVAPPPPPATAAAFSKKSEESNGVIAMIDMMVADLTKEMTEAEAEEKNAQEDYEGAMKDAADKRATDSKSLADKQKAKAQLGADLEASGEEKAATTKTLMATLEHIQALHAECDWLLQYFQVRKEARTGEIESLKTAKSVLSGASFALL
jgi:septal ring factor EnvC (AmiA/AmiB activator)